MGDHASSAHRDHPCFHRRPCLAWQLLKIDGPSCDVFEVHHRSHRLPRPRLRLHRLRLILRHQDQEVENLLAQESGQDQVLELPQR